MHTLSPRLRLWSSIIVFAIFVCSIALRYLETITLSTLNSSSFDVKVDISNIRNVQGRQLIHVVSPFITKDTNSTFAPLSHEQLSMLVSVRHAQEQFNVTMANKTDGFQSVLLVCAVLSDEYNTLIDILAPYCQRIKILHRHTGTEYATLLPNTKLTFLQDIVDEGISCAEENDEDYYLMLTNADICLMSHFYSDLSQILATSKRKALSINRKVLSNSALEMSFSTNDGRSVTPHNAAEKLLQQAHNLIDKRKYRQHQGFDCFIMHKYVVKSLNFGDQFVGYPFWGTNIDFALHIMEERYTNIKSKELNWGTFHLGNEQNWMPSNMKNPDDDQMTEWKRFGNEDLAYIQWCPVIGYPPQDSITILNAINCGKWFKPVSNDTTRVPAFVNVGYEAVYLKNFAKHLNLTSEGLPIVRWKRKSTPEERQAWIQKWG